MSRSDARILPGCSTMTGNCLGHTPKGHLSGSRIISVFFLVFAGLIVGFATVFAGGPVAQSPGELRTYALICCLLIGSLGVCYCTIVRPLRLMSRLESLLFLVPVYAFCQVLPLPLKVVRILSPARAKLADALQPRCNTFTLGLQLAPHLRQPCIIACCSLPAPAWSSLFTICRSASRTGPGS